MRARRGLIFGAAASGLLWRAGPSFASGQDFEGEWHGVLESNVRFTRVRLTIEGENARLYDRERAQEAVGFAHVEGARVRLTFPSIKASYVGRLSERRIVGQFRQADMLPLVFSRSEGVAAGTRTLTRRRLESLRKRAGAPGLAATADSRDGRTILIADGVRAYGRRDPITTTDIWHLGSITKAMTASLVAKCVEARDVSWDQTIGSVLGAAIPEMRTEYRDATFRHLLCHRAGVQASLRGPELVRYRRENPDPRAERIAFAREVLQQKPVGAMERTFTYSNSGYVVVGAMLETVLGAPWEAIIRERLFEPLGMASAGFGAPGTPGAYDQPVGHSGDGSGRLSTHPPGARGSDLPVALGPAGRVHTSLCDLMRFLTAHRDRVGLLRAESWETLHAPPFGGSYAMGWDAHSGALWHTGSNAFWYVGVMVNPTRGVAAAAATNDGRLQTSTPAVVGALLSAVEAVT